MAGINLTKQTVNLSKQQTINLSKDYDSGLNEVRVGLGWDPVEPKPIGGFLGALLGLTTKAPDIDCDAWVCAYDNRDNIINTVYFNSLTYNVNGLLAIQHHGDNLTGEGKGDDEVITIYLDRLPANVTRLMIGVTIYRGVTRNQSFDIVKNVFIRLVDTRNSFEICRYENRDMNNYPMAQTFYAGNLVRGRDGWEFKAIGYGDRSGSIGDATVAARQIK